jgi:hypothetical protein
MESYRDWGTYSGSSDFAGVGGKLVRAKYQLRELNDRFRKFAESHPYSVVDEFELRPGEERSGLPIGDYWFRVGGVGVPKREWAVLIGELVHNLRSALDHAVYAAAEKPDRDTQFPIFTRRKDWDKKACRMIYSVPDEPLALIEEAQPYHAPVPRGHVLAVLNRLSNQDKHRLLHTTVLRVEGMAPGFAAEKDVAGILEIEPFLGPLEQNANLARVRITTDGPEPKMRMYGEFSLDIAFDDPTLPNVSVEEILSTAFRSVESLTLAIEYVSVVPAGDRQGLPLTAFSRRRASAEHG